MKQQDRYSIKDLHTEFPNDDACLEYLFDSLHTRECSCGGKYSRLKGRKQFQCSVCRFQIAPMVNTIFQKTSTSLTLWFHAIFIFSNAKSGISAKEMERQLGVTYKTAWRILRLIRESLTQNNTKLKGEVEMDEAFMGGVQDGGKYNSKQGQALAEHSRVIGAVERGGILRAKHVSDLTANTIGSFIEQNIDKKNTRLLTDSSNRYGNATRDMKREYVNHSREQYTLRDIHVNHIESFWSHIKRSIKGTHKVISKKYLQTYLDGFVFHYNNRHSDRQRFDALLSGLLG